MPPRRLAALLALWTALSPAALSAAPVERLPAIRPISTVETPVVPPLLQLGAVLGSMSQSALASQVGLSDQAKVGALQLRAAALASSLAKSPAAAQAAAPAPRAGASSAAALASSARQALASVSVEELLSMPEERLQAFAASLLGEKAWQPSAPAPVAPGDGPALSGEPTAALVSVLRDARASRALLLSMGPGFERVDAARFQREARGIYAEPAGSGRSRSFAAIRFASLTESRRHADRIRALETAALSGAPDEARKAVRAARRALAQALDADSEAYTRRPSSVEAYQPELAVAAVGALRAALAALPLASGERVTRARETLQDALDRIESAQLRVKALSDLNRLTSEGIVRARVHRQGARALQDAQARAGFDRDPQGAPIADVAVVGAGAAGLAMGLHSVDAGLKTVVFEAGFLAQSFTDAAMKPIYRMRTPGARNSLAQAPFSSAELVGALGLPGRLKHFRERGQAADTALFEANGRPPLGGARANLGAEDASVPSARNELLQHFAEVGDEIARRGGFLLEQTPISKVSKRADGLWELRGPDGLVQLARELVMAQGQVGVQVELGNFGQDLEQLALARPEAFLALRDRHALVAKNAQLHAVLRDQRRARHPKRTLILHDSLLGAPEIERSLQLLPAGAHVAIVGSGESAVKSAMAVLRLNQGLHVDLFTQGELKSNQLQVPAKHVDPAFIEQALNDPKLAEECIREWQEFGVPVTPGTIADLKEQAAAGRLTIHPLGRKAIIGLEGSEDDRATVRARLRRGKNGAWVLGLYTAEPALGERLLAEIDGPIVAATGYSRRALRRDPLTQQLLEQGFIRFKRVPGKSLENEIVLDSDHPLSSALDPDLFIIGAQNYGISADSTIPGAAARAAVTAAYIAKRLHGRATPAAAFLPAAPAPAKQAAATRAARAIGPVAGLVAGLALLEGALDARGTVLPTLIDGRYGHGSALALAAVAYNLAGIAGRQAGAALLDRLGLRKAYTVSLAARALVFAGLALLLAAGLLPLPLLLALVAADGFLYGASYTAESVAPAQLVGTEQAALERLSMWQQLLLPLVALAVPLAVGPLVAAFGFGPVLAAIPVLFAGAAVWLSFALKPAAGAAAPAPASRPRAGALRSLVDGARRVFADPALRGSYAAYLAFNLFNPLIYAMIAPLYALRLAPDAQAATSVFGWLAGLYSAGWLLAGASMALEQRRLAARPGAEPARLRRSMLRAMGWASAAVLLLASFAFSPQTLGQMYQVPASLSWLKDLTLPALLLVPFGMAQVLAAAKTRSFFQSKLPADAMTGGMAFLGASSLAVVTASILILKWIFGAFSGMLPFILLAAALPLVAAGYAFLTRRLARRTEVPRD